MAAASDLAAMGAAPADAIGADNPSVDEGWLTAFVDGLKDASEQTGLPLVGGDTTRGPLSVTVTVMGSTPTAAYLKRSGAREGDRVCVSGTLGDAAAGLAALRGDLSISDAMVSNALVGGSCDPSRGWRWESRCARWHRRRLMSLTGYWQMQRTSPMPVRSRSISIVTDCRSRMRCVPCPIRTRVFDGPSGETIMSCCSRCRPMQSCPLAARKLVVWSPAAGKPVP